MNCWRSKVAGICDNIIFYGVEQIIVNSEQNFVQMYNLVLATHFLSLSVITLAYAVYHKRPAIHIAASGSDSLAALIILSMLLLLLLLLLMMIILLLLLL